MTDYYEGQVVRIIATFNFDVTSDVAFELDDNSAIHYGDIPLSGDSLEIVVDPTNAHKCYVDIDTFNMVLGWHDYHFYSRGDYKAAAKGTFKIV